MTTLSPTAAKLLAAVRECPADWDVRLILADCLEEEGDEVGANGARYQARKQRLPRFRRGLGNGGDGWEKYDTWEWWSIVAADPDRLPQRVFDKLDGEQLTCSCKSFRTIDAAELALAQALWELGIRGGEQ